MGLAPVEGLLGGGDDVVGVAASGSPISRWTTSTPAASRARALASTWNADSVPSRVMRSASSMTGYGKPMRDHEVRAPRAVPARAGAGLAAGRGGRRPRPGRARGGRDGRQPVLDDVAVALAALDRDLPAAARAQALAHPREGGATVLGLGLGTRVAAEWPPGQRHGRARARLPRHLPGRRLRPPRRQHPAAAGGRPAVPPPGADLVRAIVTAYQVQVALTTAIDLHRHKIDHVAHLGLSVAAGLALLGPPVEVTYQAVNQALHVTTATRQSRKGAISSWKAFAPAHAGKLAVEAVDRATGQGAPAPIWEGRTGWWPGCWTAPAPATGSRCLEPGEPRRAILDTYTKAHSAEYQAQTFIDLAIRLRERVGDPARVERVVLRTSDHTHHVIGTGAGDPEKLDPAASRETLDHSVMYILAVALQDGRWHHADSYTPSGRPAGHGAALAPGRHGRGPGLDGPLPRPDPARRAFGGRAEVQLAGGEVVAAELAVADAHLLGADPFTRPHYLRKLATLAEGVAEPGRAGAVRGPGRAAWRARPGRAARPHGHRRQPARP